jgi:uncharacterized protein YjbJ (UPF0337 family)
MRFALPHSSKSNFGCVFIRETIMNWDQVQGNWEQFKGQVRQKWGKLTDSDLEQIKGKRQELAGRIQERYGFEKDRAEREIEDFVTSTEMKVP